jgi:hypothetical protein
MQIKKYKEKLYIYILIKQIKILYKIYIENIIPNQDHHGYKYIHMNHFMISLKVLNKDKH